MLARLLRRTRLLQPQPATTPPVAVTLPHHGMATVTPTAPSVVGEAMTTLLLALHRHLGLCPRHHRLRRPPQLTMRQSLPPAPGKLHPRLCHPPLLHLCHPPRVRAAPPHGSEHQVWVAEAAAPLLAATAKP